MSSLTNVDSLTSNFRQSVQICCGEKEREENNGNCKAFSVAHKRNNKENNKLERKIQPTDAKFENGFVSILYFLLKFENDFDGLSQRFVYFATNCSEGRQNCPAQVRIIVCGTWVSSIDHAI